MDWGFRISELKTFPRIPSIQTTFELKAGLRLVAEQCQVPGILEIPGIFLPDLLECHILFDSTVFIGSGCIEKGK